MQKKRSLCTKVIPLLTVIVASSCSETAQPDLVLSPLSAQTASITINNVYDFTIGVVTFQDCETKAFARPEPQVIPQGENATYEVAAPACYDVISGEAGLSTKFATNDRIRPQPDATYTLPLGS